MTPPRPPGPSDTPPAPAVAAPSPPGARRTALGAEVVLVLVAIAWGVNPPIIKVGLASIAPQPYNLARLVVACLVALAALALSGTYRHPTRADLGKLFRASAFGFFVFQLFFTEGIQRTTSGNASFILCLMPVTVILLNRLYGLEALTRPVVAGVACSIAGVLLIVRGADRELSLASEHLHGGLMLLAAQAGYAYYTVFTRELRARYSTYQLTATLMVFTTALIAIPALPGTLATDWTAVPAQAWASVAFSGAVGLCLANFGYIWCIGVLGAARAAVYNNLCPVVTVAVAYAMLDERFGALQALGAAVVLGGVWLTRLRAGDARSG